MATADFDYDNVFKPCDPTFCVCDDKVSCHAVFCSKLNSFGLTQMNENMRLMFHIQKVNPEDISELRTSFNEDFELLEVYSVQNPFLHNQYKMRKAAINFITGNANENIVYHTTKSKLISICNEGLDPRYSLKGFFGRGIYVSDSPVKCNDYSAEKGNPNAVRIMLQCRVILGRSKEYEMGQFDRDLVVEPQGYQSVKGFIRRNTEYVVYNRDQIMIDKIIIYRYSNTENELAPCLQVPPNITGNIVYITASLSEFFSKLQQRVGPSGSANFIAVKRLTAALLQKLIDIDQFLGDVSLILKALPPPGLAAKIRAEMDQCILGDTPTAGSQPAQAAATTGPIPAQAAAGPDEAPIMTPPTPPQVFFESDYEPTDTSDDSDDNESTSSRKRTKYDDSITPK